jgi:hypothetical protein
LNLNIHSGLYFPLGALLFSNGTYTETVKIINTTGATFVPFSYGQEWEYNWTTGITELAPVAPAAFDALLMEEITRYITYWETFFAPYSIIPGYKVGSPIRV